MSRRRPGISAGRSSISWAAKHMTVEPAVATCEPPPAPLPPRIAHPVVEICHARWFRVIRLFRDRDGIGVEHIGEFPDATSAILLGTREVGKARVYDWNGKLVSDNYQPMEFRA